MRAIKFVMLGARQPALALFLLLTVSGPALAVGQAGSEWSIQNLAGVWQVSSGPVAGAARAGGGDDDSAIAEGSYFLFDPARNLISNFLSGREMLYISDQSTQDGNRFSFFFRGSPVLELVKAGEGRLRLRNRGLEFELVRVDDDLAAIRDMSGLAGLWAVLSSTQGADITSIRYARISNYPPRLDYESRWTGGKHRRTHIGFSGETEGAADSFTCRLPDSHLLEREFTATRLEDGRIALGDGYDRVVMSRSEEADLSDPELTRLDGYWATDWEESKKHVENLPDGGLDNHSLFFFRGVTPVTLAFANLGGSLDNYAEPWNYDGQASYLPIRILDDKNYQLDYGTGGSRMFTLLDDDLLLMHYVETVGDKRVSTADAVLRRIIDCRNP